uniref:uncharacterized protein isoform X2 n=1 Tax=Myxine glutinosa TaxID=7769 RepID=UPI00358DF5F4
MATENDLCDGWINTAKRPISNSKVIHKLRPGLVQGVRRQNLLPLKWQTHIPMFFKPQQLQGKQSLEESKEKYTCTNPSHWQEAASPGFLAQDSCVQAASHETVVMENSAEDPAEGNILKPVIVSENAGESLSSNLLPQSIESYQSPSSGTTCFCDLPVHPPKVKRQLTVVPRPWAKERVQHEEGYWQQKNSEKDCGQDTAMKGADPITAPRIENKTTGIGDLAIPQDNDVTMTLPQWVGRECFEIPDLFEDTQGFVVLDHEGTKF